MNSQSMYHVGYANIPQNSWRPFMQNELPNWPCLRFRGHVTSSNVSYQCHSSFPCIPNSRMTGPSFQLSWGQAPPEVQRYLDTEAKRSDGYHDKVEQGAPSNQSKFDCITCEKTFHNKDSLNAHLKSHTKCHFPNCSFVASRQTLKLHEIQCHREGKMKIVLDTPEQIAKWREERKRNYPTLSNIKKREEEENRKIESGQTIIQKQFRYNDRQGWKYQRRKRGCSRRGRSSLNNQSYQLSRQNEPNRTHLPNRQGNKIGPFDNASKKTVLNGGALGTLATVYAATSSDDDEEDSPKNKEQSPRETVEKFNKLVPVQVHKIKLTPSDVNNNKRLVKKKKDINRLKKNHKQDNIQNYRRPSLLEMLLAPDIRHERNVLMQCIRYIVGKDFLGVTSRCNDSTNVSE